MDLLAIAALVTAAVAVVNSIFQARSSANQDYKNLVDDYQERIKELKEEVKVLGEENQKLRAGDIENKKRMANIESQLWQALERISVLEGENESLRGETC